MTVSGRPLRAYNHPLVRLACARCPRRGQYRRERLVERFGDDIALPILLRRIVGTCSAAGDCGAYFVALPRSADPFDIGGQPRPGPMTVGDLMATLQRFSPRLPVVVANGSGGFIGIDGARVVALAQHPLRLARDGAVHVLLRSTEDD